MKVFTYAPAYFYYNKESADEYITEIKRLRDTYGIDGIYSDGIPSEHQWVTGYEESRMLRELFPDGFIVAHQTGNPQNGGGPLSAAALFLPFVDTYWNATLKGESVAADNFKAPIASMTWAQYNVANCVGIPKGDEWFYFNSEGKRTKIPQGAQDLLMLEFNGRPRITLHDDEWKANFVSVLRKLKKVWEENGDKPNFYEKYYAPAAREYIRPYLQKYGDIQILNEKFDTDNILSQYGIYNTNVQIASDSADKKLKITGLPSYEEGSVLKRIQNTSGEMTIEYSFEILERGNFEQRFSDNYDNPAIGIAFGEDGKIKIRNISGNFVNIGEYKRNTKYNIRFDIDTDKHKYDVYINDIKMVGGLKLDEKVFGISEMEFTDGGFGSVCLIDNIKVVDKF